MKLSHLDSRQLIAAQGWLELGDWRSANDELENITPQFRVHPDVLDVRWSVYAAAKQWNACVDIARTLTKLVPDRSSSWIHYAYALHELKRTREAYDVLLPLAERFPKDPGIPYNLACYCCQMGDLVGARDWLAQTFELGNPKEWRLRALDDRDLVPLFLEERGGG